MAPYTADTHPALTLAGNNRLGMLLYHINPDVIQIVLSNLYMELMRDLANGVEKNPGFRGLSSFEDAQYTISATNNLSLSDILDVMTHLHMVDSMYIEGEVHWALDAVGYDVLYTALKKKFDQGIIEISV